MKLESSKMNQYQKKQTSSIRIKPTDVKNIFSSYNKATTFDEKKLMTPVLGVTTKLPTKFEVIYRKSLRLRNESINNISQKSKEIINADAKNN